MKHIFSILMITGVMCAGFLGCGGNSKTSSSAEENMSKENSYVLGMTLGTNLMNDNLIPNMDEFIQGINDVLNGDKTRYTMEEASMILQQMFQTMQVQEAEELSREESAFLAENSKKPGIIVTSSGLQYEVITEGTGPRPTAENTVRVHYRGSLTNGNVFDSSIDRGQPAEFNLSGGLIAGFIEGLQLMSVGSTYRFAIPSDIGYGPRGDRPQIPPYATLIFEIELIDIIR